MDYILSYFTEETCSVGTLSVESSCASDRVVNPFSEPISINSVFVAFKVSLLHASHLLGFSSREIDKTEFDLNLNQLQHD